MPATVQPTGPREREQRVSGRDSTPADGESPASEPREGGVGRRRAGERGDCGSGRGRPERRRHRQRRRRAERGDPDARDRSRRTGRAADLRGARGLHLQALHAIGEAPDLDPIGLDRLVELLRRVRQPVDVVLHADDDHFGGAPALVEQLLARGGGALPQRLVFRHRGFQCLDRLAARGGVQHLRPFRYPVQILHDVTPLSGTTPLWPPTRRPFDGAHRPFGRAPHRRISESE